MPQSSQLTEPLWTGPSLTSGIKVPAENDLSNILPRSSNARKKPSPKFRHTWVIFSEQLCHIIIIIISINTLYYCYLVLCVQIILHCFLNWLHALPRTLTSWLNPFQVRNLLWNYRWQDMLITSFTVLCFFICWLVVLMCQICYVWFLHKQITLTTVVHAAWVLFLKLWKCSNIGQSCQKLFCSYWLSRLPLLSIFQGGTFTPFLTF